MDDDELKMPSRAKKGSKSMRIRYSLRGLKRKSKTGKKILNQPKRPFFICVRTVGTGGSGNDVINLEQDSTHVSHSPLEHTSPCTSYNAIPNGIPNQKKQKTNRTEHLVQVARVLLLLLHTFLYSPHTPSLYCLIKQHSVPAIRVTYE